MAQKFSNAARAELSAPLSPGDTSLTLLSGGELFPVANTGTNAISNSYDWFKVVVQDSYGYEIMYVRTHALNGLVLSNILRAQENTTALYFEAGTTVGLRPTAGDMNEAVNNRVEKIAGKGLSSEDYSSAEKAKLKDIAANANNYVHPTSDGSLHVPPTSTNSNGKVLKAGSSAGSAAWAFLTKGDVGLSNVNNTSDADKPVSTAVQTALDSKQESLASGLNIKKVNGESILGSGNLEVRTPPTTTLTTGYTSGRITSVTEDGVTTSITYNANGTVATVSYPRNNKTRTETYSYNAAGQVSGMSALEA